MKRFEVRRGRGRWASSAWAWMLCLAAVLQAAPAVAGTITVAWDPVVDPDLAGYRIYAGTSSGSYGQTLDVGAAATSGTMGGLNDCTTYYMAVKSLATDGNVSSSFSQEIVGFTRPTVTDMQPAAALPGASIDVTLAGTSFQDGASLGFSAPGITVSNLVVSSCGTLTATLTVSPSTPLGAVDVTVVNPGNVPSVPLAGLTIVADPGPSVSSVQPADGAVDIALDAAISITFDRNLLASSVDSGSVQLLDEGGAPVPQAAGSPSLAGNVVTLQPASLLAQFSTYRVKVTGGAGGVQDDAGVAMAGTFQQAQGFRTANVPPDDVENLRRLDLQGN